MNDIYEPPTMYKSLWNRQIQKKMMLGKPDDMKFGRQIFGGYQIKVMVEIKRTDILRKTCWSLMDKDEYK